MGGGAVARGRAGPGDSVNASRGREEQRRGSRRRPRACRPAGGRARRGVGVKRGPGPSGGAGESGRARAARPGADAGEAGRRAPAQSEPPPSLPPWRTSPRCLEAPPAQVRGGEGARASAAAWSAEGAERAWHRPKRSTVAFDFGARPRRGGKPRAGAFLSLSLVSMICPCGRSGLTSLLVLGCPSGMWG